MLLPIVGLLLLLPVVPPPSAKTNAPILPPRPIEDSLESSLSPMIGEAADGGIAPLGDGDGGERPCGGKFPPVTLVLLLRTPPPTLAPPTPLAPAPGGPNELFAAKLWLWLTLNVFTLALLTLLLALALKEVAAAEAAAPGG